MVQEVVYTKEEVKRLRNQDSKIRGITIAKKLGISRERVRQILISLNLPTKIENPHDKKVCSICGNLASQNSKLCRACFLKNGRITVNCDFCKSLINRQASLIKRNNKGLRYTGKAFCNQNCYNKYIITSQVRAKAKDGNIVFLLKRPHKNHQAIVLKSVHQLNKGRIYSLNCGCGKQLEKLVKDFSILKERNGSTEMSSV